MARKKKTSAEDADEIVVDDDEMEVQLVEKDEKKRTPAQMAEHIVYLERRVEDLSNAVTLWEKRYANIRAKADAFTSLRDALAQLGFQTPKNLS